MKKSILFCFLFLIAISFYGCPYDTKVPISEPEIKINDSYLGVWTVKNMKTKYRLTKEDEYHILITSMNVDSTSKDTTKYSAYFSRIDNVTFLNIRNISKGSFVDSDSYFLYRFEVISNNEIKTNEVTNNIKEKFTSSGELHDFIKKYMNLSFFYGNEEIYIRE